MFLGRRPFCHHQCPMFWIVLMNNLGIYSSWTTSFSKRAINNLIQLYPQLWFRKRGFLGFTPLWWWQRPHRSPHRSPSDLQRAKHWWCLRSVVAWWRHCHLGTFPVWWWQQWILSCIGFLDVFGGCSFCWTSTYLWKRTNQTEFLTIHYLFFQGCLLAHSVFLNNNFS